MGIVRAIELRIYYALHMLLPPAVLDWHFRRMNGAQLLGLDYLFNRQPRNDEK